MFKSSSIYHIGRSHVKTELPCQDYTASWVSDDGSFAISVLCDGAGSCSHSDTGAKAVSEWFIDYAKDRRDKDFGNPNERYALLRDLQILLLKTTATAKCNFSDLSCTFLALITILKEDKIEFTSFHIGDGLIVVADDDDVKMLSDSENGQFANVTVFTTSKDVFSSLRVEKGELSLDSSFLLMSDGSSDCLYSKKNNVFSKNISVLHTLSKKGELSPEKFTDFLNTLVAKTKTGDDCSLSLLTNIIENKDERIPLALKLEDYKPTEDKLCEEILLKNKTIDCLKEDLVDANNKIKKLNEGLIELEDLDRLKEDLKQSIIKAETLEVEGRKIKAINNVQLKKLKYIFTALIFSIFVIALSFILYLGFSSNSLKKDLEKSKALEKEVLECKQHNLKLIDELAKLKKAKE